MLGLNKTKKVWNWTACGKHPAAGDYFQLGSDLPLFKALLSWVENGYQKLDSYPDQRICSYRFWVKGNEKDSIVCGVVRDSSDSLGRPYPLIIMGSGPLNGLKDNWNFLFAACNRTWGQIEHFCTRQYENLKNMEQEVYRLKPPDANWEELADQSVGCQESSGNIDEIKRELAGLILEKEAFITLDSLTYNDPNKEAAFLHFSLASFTNDFPNAVFLGGTLEKSGMAVFERPLMPTDFVRLWSYC